MDEAVVFALIVVGGMGWWFVSNRERPVRFRRRPVMTGGGLDFLFRLQRALPECTVCPQMAATALLEPLGVGKTRKQALARVSGRRIGYAVFDDEMQLMVVIELDHRPRLTRREREVDTYFADAGIKTLRFRTKHIPSEAKIRASVFPRSRSGTFSYSECRGGDHEGVIEFQPRSATWRNTFNAHS